MGAMPPYRTASRRSSTATQHLAARGSAHPRRFTADPGPFLRGAALALHRKRLAPGRRRLGAQCHETDQAGRAGAVRRALPPPALRRPAGPPVELSCAGCGRSWAWMARPDGLEAALEARWQQNPDADWQQQKAGEIAGASQKGKRGTWRELFTPRDREIFQDAAGETLAAWGFTKREQMKFLIAGLGSIGRRHLRNLLALGETGYRALPHPPEHACRMTSWRGFRSKPTWRPPWLTGRMR